MSGQRLPAQLPKGLGSDEDRPLRVCLDLNVFIASLLADKRRRQGTAAHLVVGSVRHGSSALGAMQLVTSWGMLGRLREVLEVRLHVPRDRAAIYVQAVADYAAFGPQHLDPLLTLGGTGIVPMRDQEDVHVVETAIAGRADFLVTTNMNDFLSGDTAILEANRLVECKAPAHRILITHLLKMAEWLRLGQIVVPRPEREDSV